MNCKKCGSPLSGGEKVCKVCGEVVETYESASPSTNGAFNNGQNTVNAQPINIPSRNATLENNLSSGFTFIDTASASQTTENTSVQNASVQNNEGTANVVNQTVPNASIPNVAMDINVQNPPVMNNEVAGNVINQSTIPVSSQTPPSVPTAIPDINVQNSSVMNNEAAPVSQNVNPQVVQAQPISEQNGITPVSQNSSENQGASISDAMSASPATAVSPVAPVNESQGQPFNQSPTPVEQVQMISPESIVLDSNEEQDKKKKPNKVVKMILLVIEFALVIVIGILVGNMIYKNLGNSKTTVPNTTNPTTPQTTEPVTNGNEQTENTNKTEPTTNSTTTPTTTPAATGTTTTSQAVGTAAKCSAIECIKLIKPENKVEEINNIIGIKGEITDSKYNRYYWKITEDSGIEVAYYSGTKGNIFLKVNNNTLVNESVTFSKFESDIKPRVSTGITYKEIVELIGKVEGTLVEKSSYSTKYQWVSKSGETLKVTINNQTEKCTFATVVKGN